MSIPELRGYSRRPDEGEDVWVAGALYTFKALGSENGNAYTLVEVYGRGGLATPHHLHKQEEESFYVVDGEVTLMIGEDSIKAAPGTFAFVPRGVPHGFRFDSAEARLLLLLTPGAAGLEGLFREIGGARETPRDSPAHINAAGRRPPGRDRSEARYDDRWASSSRVTMSRSRQCRFGSAMVSRRLRRSFSTVM